MKQLLVLLVTVITVQAAQRRNLVYVEYTGLEFDSTLTLLAHCESAGAIVLHVFAPNRAILELHQTSIDALRGQADVHSFDLYLRSDFELSPNLLDDPYRKAFFNLTDPVSSPKLSDSAPGFFNCIVRDTAAARLQLTDRANKLTGQYLVGTVAVGIYLMESNGAQENWYPTAEQTTLNEVVQGLD